MLGLGLGINRGGVISGPTKLPDFVEVQLGQGAANLTTKVEIIVAPDDENLFVVGSGRLFSDFSVVSDLISIFPEQSSGNLVDTPTQLKGELTFERINPDGSVAATAVGTYNAIFFRAPDIENNSYLGISFTEDTSDAGSSYSVPIEEHPSLIDLTNTSGAINQDITTTDENQIFRVTVVLKADGFIDSDPMTSPIVPIPPRT
tara:strand:- start:3489 stop:4097 length:609 start_codon:yes stop_codon:yes gene_type:complete